MQSTRVYRMLEYQSVTVDSFRDFHSQSFKSYTKDGYKGVASPSYGAASGNITEKVINIEKDKSEGNVEKQFMSSYFVC